MSTAPWVPFDVEGWPELVDALPPEWPRAAALFDLRVYDNRERMTGEAVPSSRLLADRWGWGRKKARNLMKREALWRRGAHRGPTEGPVGAQQGPKKATQTPVTTGTGGPVGAQQGPTEGPPRATRAKYKEEEGRRKKEEEKQLIISAWEKINTARGGRTLKLTKERQRNLTAALKEYTPAQLAGLVRWREHSHHPRAAKLREGGYGIDTLLRPSKLTAYMEMIEEGIPAREGRSGRGDRLSPMEALEESIRQRKAAESASAAASGGGDASTVLLFPDGGEVAVDDNWVEIPF